MRHVTRLFFPKRHKQHLDIPRDRVMLYYKGDGFRFNDGEVDKPILSTVSSADITDATSSPTPNTVGRRDANGAMRMLGLHISLPAPIDPGTTLVSTGRAIMTHGLTLRAGGDGFSDASDHFHLFFQGGPNSRSGEIVGNNGAWNQFQMQNSNSYTSNCIFLGGMSGHFYNSQEFGANTKIGVSTDRVQITGANGASPPIAPTYTGQIDLWYANDAGLPNVGEHITVRFLPGIAGLAAATYAGEILSRTQMPAPNGVQNTWRLRVKVSDLSPINWLPLQASNFVANTTWRTSTTPAPVSSSSSLTPHPTRHDTVIATFTGNHQLLLGQVVTLRVGQTIDFLLWEGTHTGYVSRVRTPTSAEVRLGRAPINEYFFNASQFTTRTAENDVNNPPNTINVKSWYSSLTNGEEVKLASIGYLPTGLALGTSYFIRKQFSHLSYVELYHDAGLTNRVVFEAISGTGYHYIIRSTTLQGYGATGWSIYTGCQDIVHHQTVADIGLKLHRGIIPNNGVAAGVITTSTFGGLCDVPNWVNVGFAAGFDCRAEADYSLAVGHGLINKTARSVEYGFDNDFKLRCSDERIDIVDNEVVVFSMRKHGGIQLGNLETGELPDAGDNHRVRYEVNDADSPTLGNAVVGGGIINCTVRSNGNDWIVSEIHD